MRIHPSIDWVKLGRIKFVWTMFFFAGPCKRFASTQGESESIMVIIKISTVITKLWPKTYERSGFLWEPPARWICTLFPSTLSIAKSSYRATPCQPRRFGVKIEWKWPDDLGSHHNIKSPCRSWWDDKPFVVKVFRCVITGMDQLFTFKRGSGSMKIKGINVLTRLKIDPKMR